MKLIKGTSLIEVLISMLLLSLVLLGLNAAQIIVIRESKSGYYTNVAIQQIQNITERLSIAEANDYSNQIVAWNNENSDVLPNGKGSVEGVYPNLAISIFWGDTSGQSCDFNKIGLSGCIKI